jgi:hypothetical protein
MIQRYQGRKEKPSEYESTAVYMRYTGLYRDDGGFKRPFVPVKDGMVGDSTERTQESYEVTNIFANAPNMECCSL